MSGLGGGRVAIRDHDFCAGLGQRFRAGQSYSLAGACHQGGFPIQLEFFQIHVPNSSLSAWRAGASAVRSRPDNPAIPVEAVQPGRIG